MNEFNYDDSAYLAHHGVKGMHWGVRKDRSAYRTSDNIKRFVKKNGKKIAIGAGIATGAALATGVGLGLATSPKARQNRQMRSANNNYNKQQSIIEGIKERNPRQNYKATARSRFTQTNSAIERIKNNPNAFNIGNKYAKSSNAGTYDVGRVNSITGAIKKNSPRSNYKATARAQYTQNGGVSTRIKNNPNAYSSNGSRAQYIQTNAAVDRIKKNKNAVHVGNKYAKAPGT